MDFVGAGDVVRDTAPTVAPDESAEFHDWVAPHLALLALVAAREVGSADADDVVQEALVRAWRRRATFRPDRGAPRSWLLGVLVDQCRRHRVRRRPAAEPAATAPTTHADNAVARLDVERAVRDLPRRQREVVVLHYLADLSVAETALVLRVSEGTVKSQLHDARRALQKRWELP